MFVSSFVLRLVCLFCVVKWQQICRSRTNCQVFFEFLAHMSLCEMSRAVRGKEHVWSSKVQDDQELKQNVLWSHGVRVCIEGRHYCFQNDHTHHELGDCRMLHMCARKFICLLILVCKGIMFGWQTGPLVSYQCFWDLITRTMLKDRTKDAVVGFCWPQLCEHGL